MNEIVNVFGGNNAGIFIIKEEIEGHIAPLHQLLVLRGTAR